MDALVLLVLMLVMRCRHALVECGLTWWPPGTWSAGQTLQWSTCTWPCQAGMHHAPCQVLMLYTASCNCNDAYCREPYRACILTVMFMYCFYSVHPGWICYQYPGWPHRCQATPQNPSLELSMNSDWKPGCEITCGNGEGMVVSQPTMGTVMCPCGPHVHPAQAGF